MVIASAEGNRRYLTPDASLVHNEAIDDNPTTGAADLTAARNYAR